MKRTIDGQVAYAYPGGKPFDAALPCVVFIHGALHDHSVWALQSRYFAHHGFSVLALDQPGHGMSGGAALASVEALAQWLVALLDAAGVQRAALVGHSMGSLVALEAAARLGERATHLVMVGSAYPMKVSAALLDSAMSTPLQAIEMVNALSHSSLAAKPSSPGPGAWLHGANRALMRRLQAGYAAAGHGNLFHHDFSICNAYAGGLEAAAGVRCPASFLLGAKDQMTPPKAAQALAVALDACTTLLPCGHALMQEAPDAVLDALVGFLRSKSGRTPPQ